MLGLTWMKLAPQHANISSLATLKNLRFPIKIQVSASLTRSNYLPTLGLQMCLTDIGDTPAEKPKQPWNPVPFPALRESAKLQVSLSLRIQNKDPNNCLSVFVCVHSWYGGCTCVCTLIKVHRSTCSVIPQELSTLVFETGSLRLVNQAGLADHPSPRIGLSAS